MEPAFKSHQITKKNNITNKIFPTQIPKYPIALSHSSGFLTLAALDALDALDARYPCILDIRCRARSAMCRWSPSKRLSGLTGDALDQVRISRRGRLGLFERCLGMFG